jgi:hypothetical protein
LKADTASAVAGCGPDVVLSLAAAATTIVILALP